VITKSEPNNQRENCTHILRILFNGKYFEKFFPSIFFRVNQIFDVFVKFL